jgi:hypothetical protein
MSEFLERISPTLAAEVALLSQDGLRRVVVDACAAGLVATGLSDDRALRAMQALTDGHVGEVPERIEVRALTEELDVIAWDIQDAIEEGRATTAEYQVAFSRARAAAAIDQAFNPSALNAAHDSLYEAKFAIRDVDQLLVIVSRVRQAPQD